MSGDRPDFVGKSGITLKEIAMIRHIAITFLAVFLVFGCGGGDKKSSMPDPLVGGIQQPTFTDASIVPAVNAILSRSDSIIYSDLYGKFQGQVYLAPTTCYRTSCTIDLGGGYTSTLDISDIRDEGLDESQRYSAVGEKNGVRIARVQGRTTSFGLSVDAESYGAWLSHSAFTFDIETIRSGSIGGVDLSGLQLGVGASIGNDTGSRPTGSATWRGVMVGATDINNPQFIRGDATLVYDAGRNDLDVSFTGIYNLGTAARLQDLRWSDLAVDSSGSFGQETSARNIEGRFYGPGHSEVGGVFTHPQAVGAFGARR